MDRYEFRNHSVNCHARLGTGICEARDAGQCRYMSGRESYLYGNEPLAEWERAVLLDPHRTGEGDVVFTLEDGRTVRIENVRVDSVGPSAEAKGVIGVEFFGNDRVVHVPFVKFWEFEYRF